MEFLINIRIEWPPDMNEREQYDLTMREREKAAEYAEQGHLIRMWRVPGRFENWGLWRAADPTELHAIVSSLPVWPYMDATVHALARHPVDPACGGLAG